MGGRVFVYLNLHATRVSRQNLEDPCGTISLTYPATARVPLFFFLIAFFSYLAHAESRGNGYCQVLNIVRERPRFKAIRVTKR